MVVHRCPLCQLCPLEINLNTTFRGNKLIVCPLDTKNNNLQIGHHLTQKLRDRIWELSRALKILMVVLCQCCLCGLGMGSDGSIFKILICNGYILQHCFSLNDEIKRPNSIKNCQVTAISRQGKVTNLFVNKWSLAAEF